MTKRIGHKMVQAARFVEANDGCAILPVAKYVGPHGSTQFGYAIVHRAIKAGLITATPGRVARTYALHVPQAAL